MNTTTQDADGVLENSRHNELLAWATRRIDQITSGECARSQVSELLDWMAYFTREHFGFQERLLVECGRHYDHLANRAAIHLEFRRQLAQLCIDCTRGDPTVPERLRELCHKLLADAQAEQDAFTELMRTSGRAPRLRPDRRRRLSDDAADYFRACLPHH